ncbi:hypothetical protein AVEN_173549-1 [Araneus ventricosus]|uniref:Uncharacterized protein n=1 Tax=Araneus ventricosus TaxID=182803 RepID=A0A4Y2MVQ3_ARAVE|nr:hypothetical protein AVEN_173549-1 [Araneus ventricosus]
MGIQESICNRQKFRLRFDEFPRFRLLTGKTQFDYSNLLCESLSTGVVCIGSDNVALDDNLRKLLDYGDEIDNSTNTAVAEIPHYDPRRKGAHELCLLMPSFRYKPLKVRPNLATKRGAKPDSTGPFKDLFGNVSPLNTIQNDQDRRQRARRDIRTNAS